MSAANCFILRLPDDVLVLIAAQLSSRDIAALSSSCAQIRQSLISSAVTWREACSRDWRLDVAHAAVEEARQAWRRCLVRYGSAMRYYAPAKEIWTRIERFAVQTCPAILANLAPGSTETKITAFEKSLSLRVPEALRALWLVHNGELASQADVVPPIVSSAFGTQVFYGQIAYLQLYTMSASRSMTKSLRERGALHRRFFVVGIYGLNGHVGALLVIDSDSCILHTFFQDGRLIRAVSHEAAVASATRHGLPAPESEDRDEVCILRFLSEHAWRLENGVLRVRTIPEELRAVVQQMMDDDAEEDDADDEGNADGNAGNDRLGGSVRAAPPPSGQRVPASLLITEDEAFARTVAQNRVTGVPTQYLCGFPEAGQGTSYAVTQGVHTHVSCKLIPSMASAGHLGLDASLPPPIPADGSASRAGEEGAGAGSSAAVAKGAAAPAPVRAPRMHYVYRVRAWYSAEGEEAGATTGASASGPSGSAALPASGSGGTLSNLAVTQGAAQWPSVKLTARTWNIEEPGKPVETVQGPGVVGLTPVLEPLPAGLRTVATTDPATLAAAYRAPAGSAVRPDVINGLPASDTECDRATDAAARAGATSSGFPSIPAPFEYASQTNVGAIAGSMGGSFTMVPWGGAGMAEGHPVGPPFEAQVATWQLSPDGFIF